MLKNSSDALFIVRGAMLSGFPDLMADLLDFIARECPSILVVPSTSHDLRESPTLWKNQPICLLRL